MIGFSRQIERARCVYKGIGKFAVVWKASNRIESSLANIQNIDVMKNI